MGSVTKEKQDFLESIDHVIAISRAAQEMLKLRWGYNRPITIIQNPRRPDIPLRLEPRNFNGLRPFKLGFIGRLTPLKGAPLTLHILAALKKMGVDVELVIAGHGEDAAALDSLTKKLELQNSVKRMNVVSNVVEWYDQIELLLIPSIREPLGLISLEAAARGIPVVAAAVDGLPEVIDHNYSGICIEPTLSIKEYISIGGSNKNLPESVYNPTQKTLTIPKIIDPSIAAEAICSLINDPELYLQYSLQALKKASTHSTFEQYTYALTQELIRQQTSC